MRHTVFVFPTELTAVVHASTGITVAARERASLLKDMAAGAPDAAWLKEVEESVCWTRTGCGGRPRRQSARRLRLRGWVGATRVTPRFRTPLERELA